MANRPDVRILRRLLRPLRRHDGFSSRSGRFFISALAFVITPFMMTQAMKIEVLPALINHLNFKQVGMTVFDCIIIFGEFSFLFLIMPFIGSPKKFMAR